MTATKEKISEVENGKEIPNTTEITWRKDGKFKSIPEFMGSVNGEDGYHLVKYSDKGWYAFFRPKDWEMFGNSCAKYHSDSMCYPKVEQAKEAASRHLLVYGFRPNQFDHLLEHPL